MTTMPTQVTGTLIPAGRPSTPSEPISAPPSASIRRQRRLGRAVASTVATAASVLVTVVGCVTLVVAVASRFSAGQYVVFGHPVLTMLSGSMSPAVRTGDLVVDRSVSASTAASLQVGQIITFRAAGDRFFTHRIYAVDQGPHGASYVTKGDANGSPDATRVVPSAVVGVFDFRIPDGGYALNALRQPVTLVLLGVSLLALVFGGPLWRWAGATDVPSRRKHDRRPDPRGDHAKEQS